MPAPATTPSRRRPPSRPAPSQAMSIREIFRVLLRSACWVAIVVGLAIGLYLTLRPSGNLNDVWWLPRSVRHWAEYNGRLRNLPAFALLAVPFMIVANGRRARRRTLAGLAAFVALTELAQYYLPTRWCEWQDVAYGWTGLLATWLAFEFFFWAAWRIRLALKRRNSPASTNSVPPLGRTVPPHPRGTRP